jgi:hypothetical protein
MSTDMKESHFLFTLVNREVIMNAIEAIGVIVELISHLIQ